MSTTLTPTTPRATEQVASAPTHDRVTFARVMGSEWLKFRTLRSSWYALLAAVTGMILICTLIGYQTGKNFTDLAPEDSAPSGVLQGYFLAQLIIGVLGVLFVSGEYTTGMIRSTLAAVPRRVPVLGAKAVVFGVFVTAVMTVTSLVSFFAGQAFLRHYGHGSSLSDPTVLRVILGTGLYLGLIGLLGGALGWILRSTPGGISALLGLLLVVPVILGVLPGQWSTDIGEYLPSNAGSGFTSSVRSENLLAPGAGLAVVIAWVVGALGVAAVLLRRRDA